MKSISKDDPLALLSKPSYSKVVLKLKANHLDTLFAPCCYTEVNSSKLYKWVPNDTKDIS